jgi:hypothetical protein
MMLVCAAVGRGPKAVVACPPMAQLRRSRDCEQRRAQGIVRNARKFLLADHVKRSTQ